ncbi:M20/M25/M40 family metallo-hydrolase [Nocardioides sp. zg-1228]|uniref:M20/M25/M40 family metallo-hydrolase n=1 Tax=Nocardioides sp. zg-1228 TaxID=2763008 RepID=UPI0016424DD2|nr:M20/M25/M40 family metallo-hydrolase [Nocardioides sp. zg-1228]MBC2931820.1 M20/M25/M40 family metallo-hydrolase [Nocardioides sp. zg-1228]QSF57392.1 M20/M25/M40 family metallo-hydrolase [Nocardioides sp. zg-1228]
MTDRVVAALQALVRIPTVSDRDPARVDADAFDRLLAELATRFPLLHERLSLTRVASHGLLFHWAGASAERPVVLMAHLDVVPVDAGAPWQHDPFGGEIHDSPAGPAIWGRGTLDDKGCVAAVCEAVEQLLEADHVPAQDVWLSFGCDEEVSGTAAADAVEVLRTRGVTPWLVLDEGGAIAGGAFPGVKAPLGVIGVTEKGTTSLELVAEGRGGHASTPARNGPTARIARAILRLEKSPFPASAPAPTLELARRLAPHVPLPLRPLLGRADRLAPVITRALVAAGPEAAAMTRTTVATTTLSGSPALNVIASTARAGLNIRVMVGDTVAGVVEHVRRVIDDDAIRIDVVETGEPSPVSPMDEAFELIEDCIGEVFPDAVATPYVMMAATDSRHFTAISDRVYRFAPFRMSKAQRAAIHSYDEHLGVADLVDGVRWYRLLVERLPA